MSSPKFSRLDPAQRRDQILDAASALFAERPYDAVSIEDIASAAGVTRGLVHHYFGGRKEVYIALVERIGALREERLPRPVARSARARAADDVSRWLDWTEANRTFWARHPRTRRGQSRPQRQRRGRRPGSAGSRRRTSAASCSATLRAAHRDCAHSRRLTWVGVTA